MKLVLLIALIALYPVLAAGQARTAESIVSIPHSQLGTTARNGSVRHVINGLEGTTPCQAGGSGAIAYRINGVWECPKLTPGIGTGDVLGPSASAVGEMMVYGSTSGKNAGRSNTLNGIALLTSGVVTGLASTGSGNVVRSAGPVITGVNASNIFDSGTIPPARVISGTLTNQRCLRLNNTGQIEVAANDCGTGGGGAPGGVSGNLAFNESGAFGGLSNTSYDSSTGRLLLTQKANGNDTLTLARFTDSSPVGTLLRVRDATNTTDLFAVNANGSVFTSSTITVTNTAAPATPSAGNTILWTDLTDKNLKAKDDAGNVSATVRAITCTGTDKLSAISSAGVPTCSADQTSGGGSGITTLNALTAATQTFADVDDTNVTLAWSSVTSTHTLTVGWTGTLAKARQNAATVYNDASNTWTTGAQDFGSVASLKVPTATGASPSASALIAYDSTSNTLEYGENGTNRTVANTAGSQTFANKTLDNSNTLNIRDTLLTLQDNVDSTKTVNFELSSITTGTNRVVTVANAASVTVQPTTATTDQFVTHIDSTGLQVKAQPTFAGIGGSLAVTQGSTGQSTVSQGDLLFGSTTNVWSRLAKSTSATRYLSNTGASNNPAWAQVDLTNGVIGLLPPANWSPLTTKGDLAVHNGTTTTRQAVGTNGFALLADSTQTTGVRWGAITATAGGSTTQLQSNSAGSLAGISGATTDGTAVTFSAGNIIVGSTASAPTPSLGRLYVDSDDNKLYYGINGTDWGEVFVSGLSVVNLASANVTGVLPIANGGTSFSDTTFSGSTHKLVTTTGTLTSGRCAEWDASGNIIQAAAACSSGGSGTINSATITQVAFYTGATTLSGDAGMLYDSATDTLSVGGPGNFGAITSAGNVTIPNTGLRLLDTDATHPLVIVPGSNLTVARNFTITTGDAARTLSMSGNLTVAADFATSGANALTLTTTGATNVTLPTTGTVATLAGTEALTGKTVNGLTITTSTGTLTVANGKTATLSNTLTFTGTDSSSVAFGGGGTVAYTVASGTSALGTSAIASGTCATVVTTAATGTATTDVIGWGFNGDPTGVTGYAPSANGMLTIIAYPSANNVNFKVCNNLAASVTPGTITLNWRVTR